MIYTIIVLFVVFFIFYIQLYSIKSVNHGNNHINQINNPEKNSFETMIREKQPTVITNVLGELSFSLAEVNKQDNDGLKKKINKHFKYYLLPLSANHNFNIFFDKKNVAKNLTKQNSERLLVVVITGVQKLILFNPDQTKYLYKSKINPGKSEVNFWDYSPQVYPEFSKSNYVEIIVRENQMVYIPYGWWWTSKSVTDTLTVVCNNDSFFSFIFKKMGVI